MDNRQLTPDDATKIIELMTDATHEAMGSLTVHTGTYSSLGEIVIVGNGTGDFVLVHGDKGDTI